MRLLSSYLKTHLLPICILLLLTSVVTTGCDSTESNDEPVNLSGTWTGEITHPSSPGTMRLTASHLGSRITGRWNWAFVNVNSGNPGTAQGTFEGTVTDDGTTELTLMNIVSGQDCAYLYAAEPDGSNQISGSYIADAATCRLSATGMIVLERE